MPNQKDSMKGAVASELDSSPKSRQRIEEIRAHDLIRENKHLLKEIREALSEKKFDSRIQPALDEFFIKMEQVLKYLEWKIPPNIMILRPTERYMGDGRKDDVFVVNLNGLLDVVPQELQNITLQQIPNYFRKSIEKIIYYFKGDDSWLSDQKDSVDCQHLKMKDNLSKSTASMLELQTDELGDRVKDGCDLRDSSSKDSNKSNREYDYLLEYSDVSSHKEITHILDPLFQMLYPQQTMVSSMKHCKETTGKTLAAISREKLGSGERGNKLLYKILTDNTLARIFGDDRIIAALEESIHIPLLKAIIYTTVYRLRKFPAKFPVIGGVSYFVDIEEEALGTDLIKKMLLDLIVDCSGSKAIFQSASAGQRGGIDRMMKKNPMLYREVAHKLLDMGSKKSRLVTKYWTLKFSCDFVRNTKLSGQELQKMFLNDRLEDLKRFA